MIDSMSSQTLAALGSTSAASATSSESAVSGSGFDAALEAAQKRNAAEQARADELDTIKQKGFSAWVRDTQIEKLKEELRKKVMAEMGVDENDLSKLSSVMQQILEKKIQDEVDKRLQEELAKQQQQQDGQSQSTLASAQQAGKNDQGKNSQDGKDCPVIPALAWPGAPSVF